MLQTTEYRSFPIVDNAESMTFLGSIRRVFLERALERALQYNQVACTLFDRERFLGSLSLKSWELIILVVNSICSAYLSVTIEELVTL